MGGIEDLCCLLKEVWEALKTCVVYLKEVWEALKTCVVYLATTIMVDVVT